MIAISVAAQIEWNATKQYYGITEVKKTIYGEYFYQTINNQKTIFYMCGTRKMCSSGAVQYMIDKFNIDKVIVVGTCAGIDKNFKELDVILPQKAVQYDCTVRELEPLIKNSFSVDFDLSNDIGIK